MTAVMALHGAGDRSDAFARTLGPLAALDGRRRWVFPEATTTPTVSDRVHYSGIGAAAFAHPCWDLDDLREQGRDAVVVGFSMGAITAMRLLDASPSAYRGVVCLAGCSSMMQLVGSEYVAPAASGARVLFVHGTADRKVPHALSRECADRLAEAGAHVDYWLVPGAGHDLCELGLNRGSATLERLDRWIGDLP